MASFEFKILNVIIAFLCKYLERAQIKIVLTAPNICNVVNVIKIKMITVN